MVFLGNIGCVGPSGAVASMISTLGAVSSGCSSRLCGQWCQLQEVDTQINPVNVTACLQNCCCGRSMLCANLSEKFVPRA